MTVVIDASALLDAFLGPTTASWARLVEAAERRGETFAAPALLWSEGLSVVRERVWRDVLPRDEADRVRAAFEVAPVERLEPDGLRARAWEIADRMGWAKTYDAEYCGLAELLGCDLVTGDLRLRSAGRRLGYVWTAAEAAERLATSS